MTITEPATHVEVATPSGRVRGAWRGSPGSPGASAAFLGIPFAEPPVGELRFAAPVPVAPWEGVRDALEFGATAQRGDPGVTLIPEPSVPGQSTLGVNVFTPAPGRATTGAGLPVLVWIHGGGYIGGSPASPWYDGRAFNRDGVVTVTISYRLGFDGFGWIADAPANRGVLDWLLALEWVRGHIAAFGGDPGRVTIAGQSAGGGAVLTLLGMPRAQGLFHRAWAVSPATADVPAARAEAVGRRLAALGGVEPTRAGLGELPESRVLELQELATKADDASAAGAGAGLRSMIDAGLPWGPVVDGSLVPRPTRSSYAAGVGADVPLVLGSTDDEFAMAFRDAEARLRRVPAWLALGRMGLTGMARREWLRANREVRRRGTAAVLGRYVSDRIFRAPVVTAIAARTAGAAVADGAAAAGTWAYRFTWRSPAFGAAVHCLDVPFLFDCLADENVARIAGPTPPQELADAVHAAAVAFVRGEEPSWPRATGPHATARIFDVPVSTLDDAYASTRPLSDSSSTATRS